MLPIRSPQFTSHQPIRVLNRLIEGNRRFAAGCPIHPNASLSRRRQLTAGQQPMAAVFACSDSREVPELIFDCGLGDLFVCRTAGHVLDQAVEESLVLGVGELKPPLLIVLGHSRCAAVQKTIETLENDAAERYEIGFLVQNIRPAVEACLGLPGSLLEHALRRHVEFTVERLAANPHLAAALQNRSLLILGAVYDLASGLVELLPIVKPARTARRRLAGLALVRSSIIHPNLR